MDDTVAKCSIRYSVYSVATREVDLQDGEVIDDRCRNRHNDQECCGSKQQYCAEVVEESTDTHDGGLSRLLLCMDEVDVSVCLQTRDTGDCDIEVDRNRNENERY